MARRYPRTVGSDREQSKRTRRSSGVMAGAESEVDSLQVHGGVVGIGRTAAPYDTSNKLYNDGGKLYWNGTDLTASVATTTTTADSSTDVTLAGTPDYITISGQEITRGLIVLTTDVSGSLPDVNIASASTWNAKQDALTFGIANTNALKVNDADATDDDYAKFTATGIEGRSYGEVKSDLDLEIGTDVQAYDAGLNSISGLTTTGDRMIYTSGSDTYAVTTLTAFARTILDDADAATVRATIGAGVGSANLATSTNDEVVTVTGSNAITGEANLTFDGSTLQLKNGGTTVFQVANSGNVSSESGATFKGNSFFMGPSGFTDDDESYPGNLTDGTNSPARGTVNFISNEGVATNINYPSGYSTGVTVIAVDDASEIRAGQSITLLHTDKTQTENREVASVTDNNVTLTAATTIPLPDNSYVDVWGTSNLNFRNANDNSNLSFDYAETGGILKFRSRTSKQNASHAGGAATSTTRFEMDGDGVAKFNAALTHPCTPSRYSGNVTLSSTDRVVWMDPGGAGKTITLPSWTHGRVIDIYYGRTEAVAEPFTVTPYLDESTLVTDVGYAGDALNGEQRVEQYAGVAEVSRLTLGDPSLLTGGDMSSTPSSDFYLIRDGNSGGPGKKYIWLKVSDDGMGWSTDPLGLVNSVQSGHLSDDGVEVEVDRTVITTAGQLASAIASAVNGYASFAAVVENTNEVKITNATAGAAHPNIRMRAGQSSDPPDPSYTGYDETVDTEGVAAVGSTTTTPTVTITAPVGSGVRFVAIRQESEGGAGDSDMNIWVASTITGATVST